MQCKLSTFGLLSVLALLSLPPMLQAQDCILGTAYEDLNNNGIQDAGEEGLDGQTITVISSDGTVNSTTTETDGRYNICVAEGLTHHVYPDLGSPTLFSNPPHYDLLYEGTPIPNNDFGIVDRDRLGFLGGDVFFDLNTNGRRDADEPTPHDVQLVLEGPFMQTIDLAATGTFEFSELPLGDYVLTMQFMINGVNIQGGPSRNFSLDQDFRIVDNIRFPIQLNDGLIAISDIICYDLNGDGQNDPEREPGINNGSVDVELLDANGAVLATAKPDAAGRYIFVGFDPGSYSVRAVFESTAYEATTPTRYDLDNIDIPVRPGPFYLRPLEKLWGCGMAVSTFGSEYSSQMVLSVKDIRDRTGVPASIGGSWSPTPVVNPNWNDTYLNEIFGIATDEEFNIYVTAAQIPTYAGGFQIVAGNAVVYSINPYTGGEQPICYATAAATATGTDMINNTGRGIGNICSNNNGRLFFTNISDGTIVVIQDADEASPGQVTQVYNITSFTSAAINAQDVWGIGYNATEQRVYFSGPPSGGSVNIYSVSAAGGTISGPEQLEATLSPGVAIADIAFRGAGTTMLLAQRGHPHNAYVYELNGSTTAWNPTPTTFYVGAHGTGINAAGGIDYAYESFAGNEPDMENCETVIAASGNALNYPAPAIYGYALIPASGNAAPNGGYATTPGDFLAINSILIDNDNNTGQADKRYQGDVEIFDCPCASAPPSDCAEENGLEMLPSSPEDPAGVGDCCNLLDYSNVGNVPVFAIDYTLLDGVTFQPGYVWNAGLDRVNYNNSSVTLANPGLSGPLPNNVNGILNFCLENITGVPQYMVIDYRDENFEVFCTDTLIFRCPLEAECLEYVQDSLVCDTAGYKFTIDFEVPTGNDFDIGYIKMNLTQNLPAGSTIVPIGVGADPSVSGHTFSPPLQAGDQVSLMYMVNTMDDLFGDSLCILITAHDNLEERLCCYAYEACIPYPNCPMPCDEVGASVIPAYQGDAATCCGGDPLDYDWLQDLIGDCTQRPCGAEVYCCALDDGTRVILIEPDPEFECADFPAELYACDGTLIATSGGITGGQLPPLNGCRLIYDCYEPLTDECCFDLLLTDTFTADPGLITAIQTTILNAGVTFSGQERLGALLNGWTPTDLVPDRDIFWTHNSGVTPNGVDQYLFTFCVEGTTSTDSVYVEVDFMNGRDSIVCTDTVAVYCPYCLQVVNDSLTCVTDPSGNQTYLYQFSFINSSAFDVNAVYVGDQSNPQDTVLNSGVHMLGTIVPPGTTYTGLIPVQLDSNLDSACFDIVLRQIVGDSINITCCYATHCIELPPCETLDPTRCPIEPNPDLICNDVYEPVCGCDNVTYSNICYAERAGITVWTPGPCPNVNDPMDEVTLVGQAGDAGNQLNWIVSGMATDYRFFTVLKWENNVWWQIATIPASDMLQYEYLDVNAELGLTTYQILAHRTDGRTIASNTVELFRGDNMGLRTNLYAYPSPARELVNITVNKLGEANIELIDANGQIPQRQVANFNGNPQPVDLSNLQDGVYIIRVRFGDGTVVQRRIVRIRE